MVTRVFGVKRDKSEFSSKNSSITARAFFQRFPRLFEVFSRELAAAGRVIAAGRGQLNPAEAAIYPCLLILAKLRPSPTSGGTDEFKVRERFHSLFTHTRGNRI